MEARIDYLERMLEEHRRVHEEIRQELRLIHQRIDAVNQRMDSWIRWMVGFIVGNYALVIAILLRVFGAI